MVQDFARGIVNTEVGDLNLRNVAPEPLFFFSFFRLFAFSRAAPSAFGGSQTRGLMGAVAASIRQQHRI